MAARFHFTKATIDQLPTPGKLTYYRDARELKLGLYVTQNGAKSFLALLTINGKTRRITLGQFPALSVPRARQLAAKAASEYAEHGIDPIEQRRAKKVASITLSEVFETYLKEHDLKPSTVKDYRKAIDETFGGWLNRPLAAIRPQEILSRYLERGKASRARTDNALRVLRAIFNFAKARYKSPDGDSRFPVNPTDIVNETRARYKPIRRRRVIAPGELPMWWQSVHDLNNATARDWLLFLLLTGVRSKEAASLQWQNIDLREQTFTLIETKNRRVVDLPLPDTIAHLLRPRRPRSNDGWVFPAKSGKAGFLSDPRKSIARVRNQSGVVFSPHDLRRTYTSIANSLDISVYTVKTLLNHTMTTNDVTAGYDVPDMARLKTASRRIENQILSLAKVQNVGVIYIRSSA
jgi:integrase